MTRQSDIESGPVEPWASVEALTAHLGIARDTIYRWIETKGMPAHRIGRLWKFKLSEVDAWVRHDGPGVSRSSTVEKGTTGRKKTPR
jgi:excisionase family DNA binding protein